jgi:hypothetical protein
VLENKNTIELKNTEEPKKAKVFSIVHQVATLYLKRILIHNLGTVFLLHREILMLLLRQTSRRNSMKSKLVLGAAQAINNALQVMHVLMENA